LQKELEQSVAEQNGKSTKRLVKNPETFRERALKASEAADKPTQSSRLREASGKAVSPVFAPIKATSGRLASFTPFRLVGKVIFPPYLRKSWQELRLVTWPNWQESRRLTTAVLIFAIVFGGVIAGVDYGLDKLFRNILLK
jgi:preprotein translocase SecE subunit